MVPTKTIQFEVTEHTFTRLMVQCKTIQPPITVQTFLRRMVQFYLEKLEREAGLVQEAKGN